MSVAVAHRITRPQPRARGRDWLPAGLPSLAGLAVLGALLPARGAWAAGVVTLALAFTVPGVIALRALRIPAPVVLAYPLFVPAASLAVMLAAGLAADLLGPRLGIHHPLQGDTTALATLAVSLILWAAGLPAAAAARLPWRRALESPAWLVPLGLPMVAAAGALLLSHEHGPDVARIGQALVAVALLFGLAFSGRLSRGQMAALLFGCALAAEWAFTLRGQEVVGFDISTELGIAQHVHSAGIWHALNRDNAYSAMLSVTVLPSTLASLTGTSPLIALKVVYPVLTALLPLSVFFIGDRFLRRGYAAGAASLLIVQAYFFQQIPQVARQEIALVFFAALVGAIVAGPMRRWSRLGLVSVLAAGLVVSHYSSTYFTIPIVAIALVLSLLLARRRPGAMIAQLACATLVLAGGAAVWYGAVTHSSSNLTSFAASLEHRGLDLLPNSSGNVISTYLNGTERETVPAEAYQAHAVTSYRDRAAYVHPLRAAAAPQFNLRPASVPVPPKRLQPVDRIVHVLSIVWNELMLVLGVLGALAMVIRGRASPLARRVGLLSLGTLGVLALIRFSGTVAANYNQTRALAQSLLLLALPAAWLVQEIAGRLNRLRLPLVVPLTLGFCVMFAYDSSLLAVVTGGGTLLNLTQGGEDYQREYMTPAELAAAQWASSASRNRLLYADEYGQLRLNATTGAVALNQVTPRTLDRHAWLYGTHTNVVLGTTRGSVENMTATYAWPDTFLHTYYDTVYSNGDSKVYHR